MHATYVCLLLSLCNATNQDNQHISEGIEKRHTETPDPDVVQAIIIDEQTLKNTVAKMNKTQTMYTENLSSSVVSLSKVLYYISLIKSGS